MTLDDTINFKKDGLNILTISNVYSYNFLYFGAYVPCPRVMTLTASPAQKMYCGSDLADGPIWRQDNNSRQVKLAGSFSPFWKLLRAVTFPSSMKSGVIMCTVFSITFLK